MPHRFPGLQDSMIDPMPYANSHLPIAESFGRFLEKRLRVPITIWKRIENSGWQNIQRVDQVLDVNLLEAQINSIDISRIEFVLPLGVYDGANLSATGQVSTAEPALWYQLACSTVREFQCRVDLEVMKLENEQFAEQAIASFEELSFLKCATGQLAKVELRRGIGPLINTIMESLRSSIRAQTVQLVFGSEYRSKHPNLPESFVVSYANRHYAHTDALVNQLGDKVLNRPFVRNNCSVDPDLRAFPKLQNLVIVPVLHDTRLMGWMVAINQLESELAVYESFNNGLNQKEFGTVEAMIINAAASIIATHVSNVDLFKEQEDLVTSVIRALVSALDAKDSYTCGHSERVAAYAKMVAIRLGLDSQECESVYLTGLLHDIGKIGIDDDTLNHPGELTEAQFNIIKQHPEDGWAILQSIKQLSYVLPGVLFHHERFDGLGYPDGLKGNQIPMVARILGVVDAYDAMTSDRPYRKGIPPVQAAAILKNGAGKQWDPIVIDAFLRANEDVAKIRKQRYVSQRATRRRNASNHGPAELCAQVFDAASVVDRYSCL